MESDIKQGAYMFPHSCFTRTLLPPHLKAQNNEHKSPDILAFGGYKDTIGD